ncbi:hypothetical protein ACHAXT_007687 [Thalassiosira profunda]
MAALPCGCRPSDLLRRALALIDPPPPAASVGGGVDLKGRGADPSIEDDAAAINGTAAIDEDAAAIDNDGAVDKHPDESLSVEPQNKKKAVRFSPECKPPTKNVSAGDALRAYDVLVHAASVSSSPPPHSLDGSAGNPTDISASWEGVQVTADVYRALLVASCLSLELLPRGAPTDGNASCDGARKGDQSAGDGACPLDCIEKSPVVPPCCPVIQKRILSTARRCILLLRVLERICSTKAIAERHGAGGSFCPRGDDIRDYDRATVDLHANYDWHDDGGLPPPCSATDNGNSTKHSILRECLRLPIRANDPPSSRFERSAWTRPLLRGERIVSLRLEDYAYREERDECEGEAIIEETIVEEAPVEGAPVDEDDAPLLNFSAAEMAREEECLLDIMLPDETTKDSNKGLTGVQKRRRGRKRRRGKGPVQSENFATSAATLDDATTEKVFAKEGFLLLIHEKQLGIGCSKPAESDGATPPLSVRVYAQLHPSGCLSIEDRSIRSRDNAERKEAVAHRRRHRDFWIGPQTQCTPCMPEGTSAFHFRLEGIRLLGASTLGGRHYINGSGTSMDLLLSVDEGTGGSFIDGYEWVTALSGAASEAASLITSIRSEWERDQRER